MSDPGIIYHNLYPYLYVLVKATDIDPPDSANGRISYTLESESDTPLPFSVETQTTLTGYEGIIKISGYVVCARNNIIGNFL